MNFPAHLTLPSLAKEVDAAKAAGLCGQRFRRSMYESPGQRVCTKPAHEGNRHSDATPKEASLEPAGTCQICFRGQQTRKTSLVLHGYKRPGWGYAVGECWGVSYAPFEVSCERTREFITKVLEPTMARFEARLVELAARPESLPHSGGIWVGTDKTSRADRGYRQATIRVARDAPAGHAKTDIVANQRHHYSAGPIVEVGDFDVLHHPSYDDLLARAVESCQSTIRMVKLDIADFQGRVAAWKPVAWPPAAGAA